MWTQTEPSADSVDSLRFRRKALMVIQRSIMPYTGMLSKPDGREPDVMLLQGAAPYWMIATGRQPLPPKEESIRRRAVP